MNRYNLAYVLLIPLTLFSCSSNSKLNFKNYKNNLTSDKGIILSFNYCGCVTSFLNSVNFKEQKNLGIRIYADSNYFGSTNKFRYEHIEQKVIDSIYEDNYNAILYRYDNGQLRTKLLKTEDNSSFMEIMNNFFK